MSTVTVSSRTGLPLVHLSEGGVVTRRYRGVERVLVESVGPSVFSDSSAPVGVEVTYLLDGEEIGSVRVPDPDSPLDTVLHSVTGRGRVVTAWEGDAKMSVDTRMELFYLAGRRSPVTRRPLVDGPVTGDFECYVEHGDVYALRALLDAGRVWLKHSHKVCGPDCTLPDTLLAVVESYSEESDADGRRFSFTWHQQFEREVKGCGVAPGATFQEARDEGFKFGDGSYLDFALRGSK